MPHSSTNSRLSALRGLYVITDEKLGGGHLPIARAALAGGARIIQLRDKTTPYAELVPIAREIRRLTREFDAIFLVNDRLELAIRAEADGLHLGPDDLPVAHARQILGEGAILGASCATPEEAIAAEHAGASYLGTGAIFGTQTKSDAGAAIGLDGLKAVLQATHLPVAAIGGVNAANCVSCLEAGAKMVCVISAITSAGGESEMASATKNLVSICKQKAYC